ncbi:MAG: exodeoxyribonuclease III [Veillonellaceae bacterium]|nr:exodeoxyribonuclease III [Veillonellaceae bacterium]
MKLVSWNVNGLRACLNKGFADFFAAANADIVCIQETKMQPGQAEVNFAGYEQFWNSAEKKGYSGTAVFSRLQPLAVSYGMGLPEHDREGRIITLEYDEFQLVNVYTPNSQRGLSRLEYRLQWEDDFRAYVGRLDRKKPVVVCGDLNVAHQEIDIKNPAANKNNAGFTPQERGKMTELLASGLTDSFRQLYPDRRDVYSWWSYMGNARERNVGWRIDYFLVSGQIQNRIREAEIRMEVQGSDHCPVVLDIF